MRISSVLCLFILLFSSACQKSTMSIVTTPDKADVFIIDPESGLPKLIGKTPLALNEKTQMTSSMKDSPLWAIKISKKGYVPEHILVDRSSNTSAKISTKLNKNSEWMEDGGQAVGELANKLGKNIKEIYRLINGRQYSEAMRIIESMTNEYPNTAIFFDIKGSLHLLKGEREAAVTSFQKSLQLNPDSPETKKALDRLRGRN